VQVATTWAPFIEEAATRFAIPASWIREIIRVESNGNPKAMSPKGAVGLMQLMPDTYAELRARCGLGDDPADPHDNIIAGTAYVRDMHDQFGFAGFIAAYNAGPKRYLDHLRTGRPLPDETLAYVAKVGPSLSGVSAFRERLAAANDGPAQQSSLFATQRSDYPTDSGSTLAPRAGMSSINRGIADLSTLVPLSGGLFVRRSETHRKR
jgi:Transglycosylase SLT domain